MLVLALDTSTPAITAGVVALSLPHEVVAARQDGAVPADPVRVLAEDIAVDPFGHAEKLMPLITGVLAAAGRALSELDAVVVGLGPGPFTGLRVGIVTAASLGDALGIGVHGVPSHDGVALAVPMAVPVPDPMSMSMSSDGPPSPLVVVTDARRREVYVSAYAAPGSGSGSISQPAGRRVLGPVVLAPAAVQDALEAVLGTGASDARTTGPGVALVSALAERRGVEPGSLSRGLVLAAGRELVTGAVPGPLVPLYLRRPDVTEPAAPKSTLNPQSGGRG